MPALWVASYSIALLLLSCLASCQVTPAGESPSLIEANLLATTPSARSANKLGVHLLLADGRHDWPQALWASHLQYARQAVGEGGFVVELVRLDDLEPGRWQGLMDLCAQLQLTPVLRLATTHDAQKGGWTAPPQDADGRYHTVAAQYAQFVATLSWPTEAHYVIVGNEPNHGGEWGGRPDPAAYARFLMDVADALHAVDPQTKVLNAGFDAYTPHTGSLPFNDGQYYLDEESFLDGMVAAEPEVFTRLDAWASHAYPLGPFSEAPWQQRYQIDLINDAHNPNHVEPPAGIYNRGVNGYEWELWKLSTYGLPPLPVLITETGWRHAESVEPTSPDNGRPLPNAETVAGYIDLALQGNQGRYPEWPESGWTPWLEEKRVIGVVFFALDGYPAYWGHTNWLVLDRQGQILEIYAPFERLRVSR